LKAKLSEYLRLVKAGEVVLVTDRDEVIAELRPARRQPLPPDTVEETLSDLAAAGALTRAGAHSNGWTWEVEGVGLPEGTAERILADLRSDEAEL
jgi:antitoxin (DNA-binding transcriptional repressor) of toxin-antitoxin stability system